MKAIINARAILPDKNDSFYVKDKVNIIFDEKISDISEKNLSDMSDIEIIDAKNKFVSPGFINIHVHGAAGADAMDENDDALNIISQAEASMGVAAFLPTTMTYDMPRIHRALKRMRNAMQNKPSGAKVLGAHMEGPFISEEKCGAQDIKHIKRADFSDICDYTDVIKIISLAIENTSDDFIKRAQAAKILLSLGHSNANFDEAKDAILKGKVSHITHLYNAMTPFHHRTPGIVGAAFDTDITTEIICDNVHASPMAVRLAYNVKGIDKIILITDSMRAACLGDGISELGGQKVLVKGELATLVDGTIAGSVAKMNRCVALFMENAGVKLEEAIQTVTKNPAKSLKIYDQTGSIKVGKAADFTIFDDKLNIFATLVDGNVVYNCE